jgi:hypothetical protein
LAESKNKSDSKGSNGRRSGPTVREVVRDAKDQIEELLGRRVEGVLGVERDGDDWMLTVEILELARVPTTTDVLGKYEVTLDKDGEITGARRTRRYPRASGGED